MSEHYSIYLDESGDMGFDWKKTNPSKHFVITLLVCETPRAVKEFQYAVRRTLKNKLNHQKARKRIVKELKGSNTTLPIKQFFFDKSPKSDWFVCSVILRKDKLIKPPTTSTEKNNLYDQVARFIVSKVKFPKFLNSVTLYVDRCKRGKDLANFNECLSKHLKRTLPQIKNKLIINHEHSHNNALLQAVDLFCWGIARKYSYHEQEWYKTFKSKVKYETYYLEDKNLAGIKKTVPITSHS